MSCFAPAEGFVITFVAHFLRIEVGVSDQYQTDQDTGNETSQEQCGYGAVCCYRIDNHGDGRRNDNTDGTSCCDQSQYEFFIITFFQHCRNYHTAYSRYCSRAGTGNSSKEHTYNNCYDSQTTLNSAEEYGCQVQQSLGDTAAAHQFTGKDEEGDRHCRERVTASYHVLCDETGCQLACVKNVTQRCNTQRETNGNCQHQGNNQCNKYYCSNCTCHASATSSVLFFSAFTFCTIVCS